MRTTLVSPTRALPSATILNQPVGYLSAVFGEGRGRRLFWRELLAASVRGSIRQGDLDHGCAEAQDVACEHPEPSRAVEGRKTRARQCDGRRPAAQSAS